MPQLTIDGQRIEVPEGATILDAARELGIGIPTLCHREGCRAETSCLVCVVKLEGRQRLVPACATKAAGGMIVESETPQVHAARRTALELLLGDHLGDCVGPCQSICPANLDIPSMLRLIAAGRMDEAVAKVRETIPFPSVLGWICPAPCEKGCRRGDLDSPVGIRLLKRYVGDYDLAGSGRYVPPCEPPTGKSVAIVGAGPAGLSAAYYLARRGHACVVLDENEAPGGGMRSGVPVERLPRKVLQAEIDTILSLGIELRSGVKVGADVSLDELREQFGAVLIATGEPGREAAEVLGIPVASKGLQADRSTHATGTPGVFVAGSALSPSRQAVRAVGNGRSAAEAIHLYLSEETPRGIDRPFSVRMGRMDEAQLEAFSDEHPRYGRIEPEGGELPGYSQDEARAEAERCLHCDCEGLTGCKLRDWAMSYGASSTAHSDGRREFSRDVTPGGLVYEPGKCIVCGLCVQIAERESERLGLTFIGRGFEVRIAPPFDHGIAAGLERVAGECAAACPTGALVMREKRAPSPAPDVLQAPDPDAG